MTSCSLVSGIHSAVRMGQLCYGSTHRCCRALMLTRKVLSLPKWSPTLPPMKLYYSTHTSSTEGLSASCNTNNGDTCPAIGRLLKTHTCNCLRSTDEGSRVVLRGFVAFIRNNQFILLRDSYGITQIVISKEGELYEALQNLSLESYIEVEGTVRRRPAGQENMSMKTGEVEVEATGLQVLSKAQAQLPFNIRAHNMPTEAIGLKHRYLQLRYPHLQRNLRLRSQVSKRISDYLQDIHGFVNVNTPTLTRHTSGGSHLFIVPYAAGSSAANVPPPANKCESVNGINAKSTFKSNSGDSRINSSSVLNISSSSSNVRNNDDSGSNSAISIESESMSKYYCLAQSPQTYKQLLMMGGLDKYYQFAVCYRDEKGTPERQPEFMQVDLEMSDVTAEEVQRLVEGMLQYSWPEDCNGGPTPETPFPVMTYSAAMKHYGSDKPDTRFQWLLQDAAAALQEARCGGITALQELISHPQGTATAFVVPTGQKHLSKSACESWNSLASREHGLGGVSVCHVRQDGSLKGSQLATQLNRTGGAKQLLASLGAVPGDTVVVALGPESNVLSCMGKLRLLAAAELEATGVFVRNKQELRFVWVVDFPLFEPGEDGSSLVSVHHPFTQPHPHDAHLLDTDPLKVRSQHYDLVCNGCEVGGGSVRIHDPEMQQRVLGILQLPPGDLQYFVDALAMGTPPHAGIALGFDRLVSLMCGSESIREVIAFPKNSQGHCTMSGAPSDISRELKQRYSIKENS